MKTTPVILLLPLLAACSDFSLASGSRVERDYARESKTCRGVADSRIGLYVRPDAYPMSDKEKTDAYYALFDSCMHERGWDIAQQRMPAPPAAPKEKPKEKDTADLAKLSPASGTHDTVTTLAPGVSMVETSAPGAARAERPTVVVVQSPASASPSPYSFTFNNNAAEAPAVEEQASVAPNATPIPSKPAPQLPRETLAAATPPKTAPAQVAPVQAAAPAQSAKADAASTSTTVPRRPIANYDPAQLQEILTRGE